MPTQVLSGVRGASCEKISHLADCPLEQSCRLPDARLLTHLIFISVDCGTTSITCPAVNFLVRQATGHSNNGKKVLKLKIKFDKIQQL